VKRALITGITGQDGAHLAYYLLMLGYKVHGVVRHTSNPQHLWRLDRLGIRNDVCLHDGDVTDLSSLVEIMRVAQPDEVYNLAAQSFVATSWKQPALTAQVTGMGALNVLEAVRMTCPDARFYQASSSELYGDVTRSESPQSETTVFAPRSPYGVAKLFAHAMTVNYRESFNMHASCGILFNHESPLRGEEFVTRKITLAAARMARGKQDRLTLGNPDALRDWGHAKDYVRAMHMMLQQPSPQEYVIATGRAHTVHEFCRQAFEAAGIRDKFHTHVTWGSNELTRRAEVPLLLGNPTRARHVLKWIPTYTFEELVTEMVEEDLRTC
jgi:GDPmannose 4,6-dehydratase